MSTEGTRSDELCIYSIYQVEVHLLFIIPFHTQRFDFYKVETLFYMIVHFILAW